MCLCGMLSWSAVIEQKRRRPHRRMTVIGGITWLSLFSLAFGQAGGEQVILQALVTDLQLALGLQENIRISVVDRNERLVSVSRSLEDSATFELLFEGRFLATLESDELRAAIAHELGHVWIFTNHPFLQTEELANRIAGRVVEPELLSRVYTKVRDYRGRTPSGETPPVPASALD